MQSPSVGPTTIPQVNQQSFRVGCNYITLLNQQYPFAIAVTLRNESQMKASVISAPCEPATGALLANIDSSGAPWGVSVWCLNADTVYDVYVTFGLSLLALTDPDAAQVAAGPGVTVRFTAPVVTLKTAGCMLNADAAPKFIDFREHLLHPHFLSCILAQPEDFAITVLPFGQLPAEVMTAIILRLYYEGLYTLPFLPEMPQLIFLPNSPNRFCIDLTTPNVRWDAKRKVRCAAKNVRLTINAQFRQTLTAIAQYHQARDEKTWLIPTLIDALCDIHNSQSHRGMHCVNRAGVGAQVGGGFSLPPVEPILMCFELWDITGSTLLAATAGFACGTCFHDYTMATLVKSSDSYGTLLTKMVGETLRRCGYRLWYWGMRLGYMLDFERGYGGVDVPRNEFYDKWIACRALPPSADPRDFVSLSPQVIFEVRATAVGEDE